MEILRKTQKELLKIKNTVTGACRWRRLGRELLHEGIEGVVRGGFSGRVAGSFRGLGQD